MKSYQINELAMSFIMLTVVENFESFVITLVYSGSLLFFHQAPQVEKESGGAEGEKEIRDSQEPHLR